MSFPNDTSQPHTDSPSLPEGVSVAHLPGTAQELISVIGFSPAMKLIAARGGQQFTVPKGKRVRGKRFIEDLAEIIGSEAAERMVLAFGGCNLTIPCCKEALRKVRIDIIINRFDEMTTGIDAISARAAANLLATEFGLASSTIWRNLKRCS